jgi:hypothetical protein
MAAASFALTAPASAQDKPDKQKQAVNEERYYRIVTLPVPKDIVLEVGGLDFAPDGRLMTCTRRGEVYAITNALSEDPEKVKYKLFARGLHESLGIRHVSNTEFMVVQRGELTRLKDTDGDGEADDFETVCNKWGISGDYHEYAFLGPREKDGSYTITLNRGFGGALPNTGRPLYRGWAVKVKPDGSLEPFAVGIRSPNGIGFNLEGDRFYTDNQGEWMATCPIHHLRENQFYGHPFGLASLKGSPLEGKVPDKEQGGLLYDGGKGQSGKTGIPKITPPACWIPYGKMAQSLGEPLVDSTAGKFGPFAGQFLIGDQTKANIVRVALEKVRGEYQGACFFFKSGFDCGIIRLCWGPDNSLFVGETNRGWGSVGRKPYGLQRLVWTGETPMEILTMNLTKTGFDLTFTKPLDAEAAAQLKAYSMQSYTYNYWGTYGSPEVDRRPVEVKSVKVSADRKKVSLEVPGIAVGRVYELALDGLKSDQGEAVLHPNGWYTVSYLPE